MKRPNHPPVVLFEAERDHLGGGEECRTLENCPISCSLNIGPGPASLCPAETADVSDEGKTSARKAVDAKAPTPAPTTVDRAAAYITEHAGSHGCKTRTVCRKACDMELGSFINTISPALKARGFYVGRGCNAAWYPPGKAAG
jgi:hypothetical protein